MVDVCQFIRIQVRYTAVFAKPQIDAVIKGKITSISSQNDRVSVVCQIEGGLDTIVSGIDQSKFALKQEEVVEKKDETSDDSSDEKEADVDSIFDEAEAVVKTEGLYLHRSFIGRTDKIEIKTINATSPGLERSIPGQKFGIDIQVLNCGFETN